MDSDFQILGTVIDICNFDVGSRYLPNIVI